MKDWQEDDFLEDDDFDEDDFDEDELEDNKKGGGNGFIRSVIDYIVTIGVVIAVGLIVFNFILVNANIPSGSMENTIMTGERIFGSRLTYYFTDPKRYDIVIFKYPDDESQLFIKRIIGMPNETVIITGGEVYVTDTASIPEGTADETLLQDPASVPGVICLDDSFIAEPMDTSCSGVFHVPEDSYFMLGDNRNHSRDSRYWTNTFVSRDKIIGNAFLRYWPLNKISLLGYDGEEAQ